MKDEVDSAMISRRSYAHVGMLLAVFVFPGCGCSGETTDSVAPRKPQAPQRSVTLTDGTELTIARNGNQLSLTAADGTSIPITNGEALFGEEMIIQTSNGQLEPHRQPSAINRDLDKLPYVYLKEGTLEELVTDGGLGEPYIHPDDQSFYWTARTCTNPDCASQSMGSGDRPYLFIHRLPGVKLMKGGQRVDFTDVPASVIEAPIRCPQCNKKEHVVDYLPAGVDERKNALVDELARVRAARDGR